MNRFLFFIFAALLLSFNGMFFDQDAEATACSGWEVGDGIAVVGTIQSSEIIEHDEPIRYYDSMATHYSIDIFKIDEILYGDEIESVITVKNHNASPGNELEIGKQYLVTTKKIEGVYVIDWCTGLDIVTLDNSPYVKGVQEIIAQHHLQNHYNANVQNAKECKNHLFPIIKPSDYSFKCVKFDTLHKLIKRGRYGDTVIPLKMSLRSSEGNANISLSNNPFKNSGGEDIYLTLSSDKQDYKYPETVYVTGQFSGYVGKWISYGDLALYRIDSDNKFSMEFEGDRFRGVLTDRHYLTITGPNGGYEEIKFIYDLQ